MKWTTDSSPRESTLSPYLAGLILGILIVISFFVLGRGLGMLSYFSSTVSYLVGVLAPHHYLLNESFYTKCLTRCDLTDPVASPFEDWIVFVVVGIVMGSFFSSLLQRRFQFSLDKGQIATNRIRLSVAFTGGVLMGLAAQLARGCTVGHFLSGGSLLNTGSWIFILCVFLGGYGSAFFLRGFWAEGKNK